MAKRPWRRGTRTKRRLPRRILKEWSMLRKLSLVAIAAASLGAAALAPTSASAWGGWHGGWHRGWHGGGFHRGWHGGGFHHGYHRFHHRRHFYGGGYYHPYYHPYRYRY